MYWTIFMIMSGVVFITVIFGKMPIARLMCLLMFLLPPILFWPLVHLYMLFDKTTNYKSTFTVTKD